MALLLFRPEQFTKLYDCSRVNISEVPLLERQGIINGTVMLILFFVFEILYIPCVVAIWKHREHSCYKFLFFIGILDILMLPIQGLVSALYSFFGVVPCSFLTFNFIIGSFSLSFFAAQTSANLFLALDRLIDTIFPKFAKFLFSNSRPWLWTMASSAFGLYYFIWLRKNYGNGQNVTKTTTVTFITQQNVVLFQKVQPKSNCATSNTNFTKILFVQVAAVNGINVATFVLFALMQNLPMSKPLIVVGFYFNYLMFGFPPIIYLLVNRTIRNECRKIFKKIIKLL
ncbi:hypothetical protein niasHS_013669 [Heterodera schachtii]|uniref:Uncharacterized protein n=1 Tax=Heterodera schachtii TaxID=97005 RepID=A0ABD2IPS5_HETSC